MNKPLIVLSAGTTLTYQATFAFAGPMAGLGEGLMRSVASSLTREAMGRFSALARAPQEPARQGS